MQIHIIFSGTFRTVFESEFLHISIGEKIMNLKNFILAYKRMVPIGNGVHKSNRSFEEMAIFCCCCCLSFWFVCLSLHTLVLANILRISSN